MGETCPQQAAGQRVTLQDVAYYEHTVRLFMLSAHNCIHEEMYRWQCTCTCTCTNMCMYNCIVQHTTHERRKSRNNSHNLQEPPNFIHVHVYIQYFSASTTQNNITLKYMYIQWPSMHTCTCTMYMYMHTVCVHCTYSHVHYRTLYIVHVHVHVNSVNETRQSKATTPEVCTCTRKCTCTCTCTCMVASLHHSYMYVWSSVSYY